MTLVKFLKELAKLYIISIVVAGAVLYSSLVYQGVNMATISPILGALPYVVFTMSVSLPGSIIWLMWLFFVQFRYVQKALGTQWSNQNLLSRIIENPWIAIFVGVTLIALPFFITGSSQFTAAITSSMYISLVCILYILVNAVWSFVSRRLQDRNVAKTKP
jgi:hypothetical protein